MDATAALAAGVLSTCQLLLISGLLLVQCCGKKNNKGKAKGGAGKDQKNNAKKLKGPNPKYEKPTREGVGHGPQYQTLGNLDKDIFIQGPQRSDDGGGEGRRKQAKQPEARRGGQAKPSPAPSPRAAPPPRAAAPPGSHLAAPESLNEQPAGQQGIGEGNDYQTWNALDQNVFVGGSPAPAAAPAPQQQQPPPAPAPAAFNNPGPGAGSQQEATPREGIGQGDDYQTWNALDQNLFVKNEAQGGSPAHQAPAPAPTPAASNVDGNGNESKAEAEPLEGIGQGADYQTWNALDKDVFVKK